VPTAIEVVLTLRELEEIPTLRDVVDKAPVELVVAVLWEPGDSGGPAR
jgi:hypothetical protein